MTIHENIKRLRKEKGLTLEALAKKINTSKQTIHRYETGEITNIPYDKIQLLAQALNCSEAELMGWSEKQSITEAFNLEQAGLLSQIRKRPKVQEAVIELLKLSDEDIEFYTENFKRMNRGKK